MAVPTKQLSTALGDLGANLAYTSYTPTAAPVSGSGFTYTSSGRYIKIGKMVHCTGQITVTANGTGAQALDIGLPVAAASASILIGFNASNAVPLAGSIASGGTAATTYKADGSYPAATGDVIRFSATYETP